MRQACLWKNQMVWRGIPRGLPPILDLELL